MTSLLQHQGKINKRGVGLIFEIEDEKQECPECGKQHATLYEAFRKPAGRFGHFVVFRYLGEEHVPDLSVPITVPKPPKGARKLSKQEAGEYWHTE